MAQVFLYHRDLCFHKPLLKPPLPEFGSSLGCVASSKVLSLASFCNDLISNILTEISWSKMSLFPLMIEQYFLNLVYDMKSVKLSVSEEIHISN